MFAPRAVDSRDKTEMYRELAQQLASLMAGESDAIANAANVSALLFQTLPDLNWAGFYFLHGDTLVLGPFQGRPACLRIPFGKGVCGTAIRLGRPVLVEDVHEFPGHIACDPNSAAELVIPIIDGERVLGVLDLDSPVRGRFDERDLAGFQRLVDILVSHQRRWPEEFARLAR